jgi:hypothetical protein
MMAYKQKDKSISTEEPRSFDASSEGSGVMIYLVAIGYTKCSSDDRLADYICFKKVRRFAIESPLGLLVP